MNKFPTVTQVSLNTFHALVNQFIGFVPRMIGCLIILTIGYLVAKGLAIVVRKMLLAMGVDRIADKRNEISFIKRLKIEIRLSDLVAKVMYYFTVLVFLTAATETLGFDALTSLIASVVHFIPKLIAAGIMLQIGIMISDAIRGAVSTACRSFNIASSKLIGNITFGFFMILTFVSALGQIGVETRLLQSTFLLMLAGVTGAFSLGYSMASKDTLSNIISSFYSRRNYKEGQLIKIDNTKGVITRIDPTSVTVADDHTTTVIPQQFFQTKRVEIFH